MRKERDRDAEDVDDELPSEDEDEEEAPARPTRKKRRRKAKAAEPDEDEEEADEEEERPRKAKPAKRAKGVRRRRKARAKRPLPRTEAQIDSPKKQTLYMLGAVAAATVLMWGAARFACNAHPPASKKPRHATTAELARTPKGAAIELQQRWTAHQFAGALALAKGEVEQQLKKELQACEADLSTCDAKRSELAGKVTSMGEVLSREGRNAKVRVRTKAGDAAKSYLIELEADGALWKAVKRTPES